MRARNSEASSRTSSRKSTRRVGGEVEDQPRTVERLLDARQLHRQAALADLQRRDAEGFALALLMPRAGDDVVVRGQPDDAMGGVAGRTPAFEKLGYAAHDGANCRPAVGLHHDLLADLRRRAALLVAEQERLRPADGAELHRKEAWRIHS